MNTLFFRDFVTDKRIEYFQLYSDILKAKSYNKYCKNSDYYTVFYNIVLSIVLGKEIVLLDEDFSKEEIERLTDNVNIDACDEDIENIQIDCFDSFIKILKNPSKNWSLTLFTSGTTGLPKKVKHSFETITRSVKTGERFENNIWGFAYNPTHMAGLQVFFQALLNLNPIIRLFKLDKQIVYTEIELNKITHISATPTFYRLLLPSEYTLQSVRNITSGGEKFDSKTFTQLKNIFPNAKFTNVYASTEAGSLFASNADVFQIKDEHSNYIKIENNELLIHRNLMGQTDNLKLIDVDWYATGDIVEIISVNPICFKFTSRKNEMINVGGYKVNPHEVEDEIRKINDIVEVRVFAKPNSVLGNIVVAEIVRANLLLTEQNIREILQTKLQDYKIPRIFKFVDSIDTTRTGKILRK